MSKSEVSAFMTCPLSKRSVFSLYIDPPVGRLALGKSYEIEVKHFVALR
jgi:hypothetical protein